MDDNDSLLDNILGDNADSVLCETDNGTDGDTSRSKENGGDDELGTDGGDNDGDSRSGFVGEVVPKPATSAVSEQVRLSDVRAKLTAGLPLYKRGTGYNFPHDIKGIPDDELDKRLDEMRTGIGRGTNHKIIKSVIQQTPVAYQWICKYAGVNIESFVKKTKKDPQFNEICEELAWEYSSYSYQRPELKLVFYFLQGTMDAISTKDEVIEQATKGHIDEVSKELDESGEYDDL